MDQFCNLLNQFLSGNVTVAQTINDLIFANYKENTGNVLSGDELEIEIIKAITNSKDNLLFDLTDLTYYKLALIDREIQKIPNDEDNKYYASTLFLGWIGYLKRISITELESHSPVRENDKEIASEFNITETVQSFQNLKKIDPVNLDTKQLFYDALIVQCLSDIVEVAMLEIQDKISTKNIKPLIYILKINDTFSVNNGYIKYLLDNEVFPNELRGKVNYNLSNPAEITPFTNAEIIKIIENYIKLPTSKPECIVLDEEIKNILQGYKSLNAIDWVQTPLNTVSGYTLIFHQQLQAERRAQLSQALKAYQDYLIDHYNLNIDEPKKTLAGRKLTLIKELVSIADDKQVGDDNALDKIHESLLPKIGLLTQHQDTIANKLLDLILSLFSQRLADYVKQNGGLFSSSKGADLITEISKIDDSLIKLPKIQGA